MGTKEQSYAGQVSVDQRVRRYNEKAATDGINYHQAVFFNTV